MSANHPDPDIIPLIFTVGVDRLIRTDGCVCGHFSIRNVDVTIRCGKRTDGRKVFINSHSLDYWDPDTKNECNSELLLPIANEVVRQVMDLDNRGPLEIIVGEP